MSVNKSKTTTNVTYESGGGRVEGDEGGDGVLNIEQNYTRIRNNLRMFLFEESYEA